ncbi:hypothetical protein [Sphingopyxis sp.]|uniref:hypothetical protein n=1 Tax=Sphingopyxis sp. TaxID=1908224 RepID=UPI001D3119B4|nr:hypothetical protein [Sphingopyxis sp.]MBW8294751.1 hypothetical protein [Sphingopyxis sp.]
MTSPSLAPIAAGVIDADLLRALAATNRPALERMIAIGIDILDQIDPDPDLEEDDPTGQCDEDELNTGSPRNVLHTRSLDGAGCVLSDDDMDVVYKPLWGSREGRAFANARRARLGLSPVGRR